MRFLLIGALLFSKCVYSQETDPSGTYVFAGYHGETISHPGIQLGVEKQLGGSEKFNSLFALSIGGYVHPRNNTSLFAQAQLGQRIFFRSGLFIDHFIGFGYLHQFVHGGATYEVLPNGAVVELKNHGQPKFKPSISFGTGYAFKQFNAIIYARPEVFWKAPFNGYYLTHLAFNAGLIIKLGSYEKS